MSTRIIEIKIRDADEKEVRELQSYLSSMPIEVILAGLRFSYNRWKIEQEGLLMIGRKSKIKREVKLLTREQAQWRLENWKMMIKVYREKGYSYPTISRIKKVLMDIAKQ